MYPNVQNIILIYVKIFSLFVNLYFHQYNTLFYLYYSKISKKQNVDASTFSSTKTLTPRQHFQSFPSTFHIKKAKTYASPILYNISLYSHFTHYIRHLRIIRALSAYSSSFPRYSRSFFHCTITVSFSPFLLFIGFFGFFLLPFPIHLVLYPLLSNEEHCLFLLQNKWLGISRLF